MPEYFIFNESKSLGLLLNVRSVNKKPLIGDFYYLRVPTLTVVE